MKRGVTGLYGKGMYKDQDKLILLCAAPRGQVAKIKMLAQEIDVLVCTTIIETGVEL